MAVQPADALQQEVSGRQIGDQHIGVHIEGLLGELGGDHHHALRPVLAGLRPHQPQALRGSVRTVSSAQPRVQKVQDSVEAPLLQIAVDRLGPGDLVDHHQGDTAIGHGLAHGRSNRHPRGIHIGQPGQPHRRRLPPGPHSLPGRLGHRRPAIRTVSHRDTRVPGRLRHSLMHVRLTEDAGQVGVDEPLALSGRQGGRQQHHRNSRLPQPAQRLDEELPHVDVRSVHFIHDHDLPGQPGEPEHHVPSASRRMQQMVDRTDRERGQQAAPVPQEPVRRPVRPEACGPVRQRLIGHHAVIGILIDRAEVIVDHIRSIRAAPVLTVPVTARARLPVPDGPPPDVEPPTTVEKRDLRLERRVEGAHPLQHLLVHRVARRLRRHRHEHPVETEPRRQNLRGRQRRLRLPLTHGRLGHQQPRHRHRPRPLHQLPLRRPRLHTQPPDQRLKRILRQRKIPPATAKPQPLPRCLRTPPSGGERDQIGVGQTDEVTAIAGNPVRHHDQTRQGQLLGLPQRADRPHIHQAIEAHSAREDVHDRPLRLLPGNAPPLSPARRIESGGRRKRPVVSGHQRPHPPGGLLIAPLGDQPRQQQHRSGHVMTPPPAPARRQPPPRPTRRQHRYSLGRIHGLKRRARLTAVVDAAHPHEPRPPSTPADLIQPPPERSRHVLVPHHPSHSSRIQQVPQQQMRPPTITRSRLPPQPRHPRNDLIGQAHRPHHLNDRPLILHAHPLKTPLLAASWCRHCKRSH